MLLSSPVKGNSKRDLFRDALDIVRFLHPSMETDSALLEEFGVFVQAVAREGEEAAFEHAFPDSEICAQAVPVTRLSMLSADTIASVIFSFLEAELSARKNPEFTPIVSEEEGEDDVLRDNSQCLALSISGRIELMLRHLYPPSEPSTCLFGRFFPGDTPRFLFPNLKLSSPILLPDHVVVKSNALITFHCLCPNVFPNVMNSLRLLHLTISGDVHHDDFVLPRLPITSDGLPVKQLEIEPKSISADQDGIDLILTDEIWNGQCLRVTRDGGSAPGSSFLDLSGLSCLIDVDLEGQSALEFLPERINVETVERLTLCTHGSTTRRRRAFNLQRGQGEMEEDESSFTDLTTLNFSLALPVDRIPFFQGCSFPVLKSLELSFVFTSKYFIADETDPIVVAMTTVEYLTLSCCESSSLIDLLRLELDSCRMSGCEGGWQLHSLLRFWVYLRFKASVPPFCIRRDLFQSFPARLESLHLMQKDLADQTFLNALNLNRLAFLYIGFKTTSMGSARYRHIPRLCELQVKNSIQEIFDGQLFPPCTLDRIRKTAIGEMKAITTRLLREVLLIRRKLSALNDVSMMDCRPFQLFGCEGTRLRPGKMAFSVLDEFQSILSFWG